MNLRPLRPEHSALPNCATFRFLIFFVFYRPSRSLVSIGIWLPFHSPSALHSDFLYLLNFIDPHAVWFQLEFGFRSTHQVRYSDFYIFCILSTLTQFGFNWNLASVPLAKCATFRFFIFIEFYRPSRSLVLFGIGFRYTRQVRYSEFIRLAGSHQQFVQQYYTKKIKNQTNFYEKFQ